MLNSLVLRPSVMNINFCLIFVTLREPTDFRDASRQTHT